MPLFSNCNKIKFKLNRPGSMLVFFKSKSFSGLRDRSFSVAAPKSSVKELPNLASYCTIANILFGPRIRCGQAKTAAYKTYPVSLVYTNSQKTTLVSGFKKVFLRKIKSLVGSFTRTQHEGFA